MKLGRNDPCSCNSGKKYKRCCMDSASKQHSEVFDEIAHTIAANPDLSLDEMNLIAQHKISGINNSSLDDFCGLSANQMDNWLRAPFNELAGVTISIPNELTTSPVMCYLAIILDEAMQQGGSFKATTKGNLPAKIAKQASELLPEFAVSEYEKPVSISEFAGYITPEFWLILQVLFTLRAAVSMLKKPPKNSIKHRVLKLSSYPCLKLPPHAIIGPILIALSVIAIYVLFGYLCYGGSKYTVQLSN